MATIVLAVLFVLAAPAQGLEAGMRAAHRRAHQWRSKSKTMTPLALKNQGTNHTMQAMSDGSYKGSATIPTGPTQQKIVEAHNWYRCKMCDTPPMTWDDKLAQDAQKYMNTGAVTGHCPSYNGEVDGCVGNGENMYSFYAADDAAMWERAVNVWFASEIDCYDFDTGEEKCMSGHFTQLAWDTSTKVGCAGSPDATGGMMSMCMYETYGNVKDQYTKHIHKCPKADQFIWFTGAANCCRGPQSNCKDGHCGWQYQFELTKVGCPAGSCSIHASCSALAKTIEPATGQAATAATAIRASDGDTVIHASGGTAEWNKLSMNVCPGAPNCVWQFEPSPTRKGMYYIKASDNAQYISALGGTNSGNPLALYSCPKDKDYANCQWALEASTTREGMYYIKASDKASYIHAAQGTTAGNHILMYECPHDKNYPNCQWFIPPNIISELGR